MNFYEENFIGVLVFRKNVCIYKVQEGLDKESQDIV